MKNPSILPSELDKKDCEEGQVKLDLNITEVSDDDPASKYGTFEGYASVFNNRDAQGEIVAPGAYKDCLDYFKENGFVAYGHEWKGLGIGFIKDAFEDNKGLYVKGQFYRHSEAQAVRWATHDKLAANKGVKMSIGYKVVEHEKSDGARILKKLDLFEVSLVNLPANRLAHVFSVKDDLVEATGQTLEDLTNSDVKQLAENIEDLNSLLASSTLQKQFEVVLAANTSLLERCKSLTDLRAKEGRKLSRANQERLQQLRDGIQDHLSQIDTLLGVGQEPDKDGKPVETLQLTEVTGLPGKALTPEAPAESPDAKLKALQDSARQSKLREIRLGILSHSYARLLYEE